MHFRRRAVTAPGIFQAETPDWPSRLLQTYMLENLGQTLHMVLSDLNNG